MALPQIQVAPIPCPTAVTGFTFYLYSNGGSCKSKPPSEAWVEMLGRWATVGSLSYRPQVWSDSILSLWGAGSWGVLLGCSPKGLDHSLIVTSQSQRRSQKQGGGSEQRIKGSELALRYFLPVMSPAECLTRCGCFIGNFSSLLASSW